MIQTDVIVIGGGATGTGILRDLAMRGFRAILVEKGDLAHGTTGRYHGLLHSGGRYAVKDPLSARQCITENQVLRRIAAAFIEDTGGYFVTTPWDDPDYADRFLAACAEVGIPAEELSPTELLRHEPLLCPDISRAIAVPDASLESFGLVWANARAAAAYGAETWTYHQVLGLVVENGAVRGVRVLDLAGGEDKTVHADLVVNAAGPWAGQIAAMAGVRLKMVPSRGTMVIMNHRLVHSVVNRCHMPADGDLIVPVGPVCIIGTTSVPVEDPGDVTVERAEVQRMLEEGARLVPQITSARVLRAYAGVRPLYQEDKPDAEGREVSRAHAVLDHQVRDGVRGLVSVVGGKLTTYRQMAEDAVDVVCRKLGTDRPCRTHLEALPGGEERRYHWLGAPLAEVEAARAHGQLICECELVTREQVEAAARDPDVRSLDDLRRRTRLGFGPCQGTFCAYRAAALFHELKGWSVEETDAALVELLEERWKGQLPILFGDQLRQALLAESIYRELLNVADL